MKILLKVLFVAFLFLIGIQLYSCSSKRAYQKELIRQGNVAYQEGDFSLFKEIFEYYKEEPFVDESVTLNDQDNRYDIENRDISFDLLVFLQAEAGKNHFTVILTNLEMENPDYSLKVIVKKDSGKKVLEEHLFRLSENNWYLQYFEFDSETIDQLLITHNGISSVEPIVLYDSLLDEQFKDYFLSKEKNDLVGSIKDSKLEEEGIIKRSKNPFSGKGTSVLVVLAVYTLFSGVLIYAVFFTKKDKRQPYKNQNIAAKGNNIDNKPSNKNSDQEIK